MKTIHLLFGYLKLGVLLLGSLAGLIVAGVHFWSWQWQWQHLAIFIGTFVAIMFGVTLYYHRRLAHEAYDFTWVGNYTLRPLLQFCAAISCQGPFAWWGANHREHHEGADKPDKDPHTPHRPWRHFLSKASNFLWAHMRWIPHARPDIEAFVKARRLNAVDHVLSYGAIYLLIGPFTYALCMYLVGGWLGIAWYFAAVWATLHLTWGVNSAGHLWGSRRFKTNEHSRNIHVLSPLSGGEYQHHNHHAFPWSARFGHRKWEILLDPGYLALCFFKLFPVPLVCNIRVPTPQQIQRRLAK